MTMHNHLLIPISVTSVTFKGFRIHPSGLPAVSSRTPRFVTVDRGTVQEAEDDRGSPQSGESRVIDISCASY